MRCPFTLFKVRSKNGLIWHARFWDESLQKYAYSRTTSIPVEGKKERRREAEETAKTILAEITVQKSAHPVVQGTQALPVTQQKKSDAVADMPLIQYLTDFWTPDSEYAKFKRNVKKKPLSVQYIENNHEDIRRPSVICAGGRRSRLKTGKAYCKPTAMKRSDEINEV